MLLLLLLCPLKSNLKRHLSDDICRYNSVQILPLYWIWQLLQSSCQVFSNCSVLLRHTLSEYLLICTISASLLTWEKAFPLFCGLICVLLNDYSSLMITGKYAAVRNTVIQFMPSQFSCGFLNLWIARAYSNHCKVMKQSLSGQSVH